MLTKSQIQRIAQRNGFGMQVQERDYLQHPILWHLHRQTQMLIFKRGTALRLVYGGSSFPHSNRYPEDLVLNGPDDASELKALWRDVVEALEDFGIAAEIRSSRCASLPNDERASDSDVGYSFDASVQGPLHDGRDCSEGNVGGHQPAARGSGNASRARELTL
jgi:predicted nucleotidyltransferase component of viral defense system